MSVETHRMIVSGLLAGQFCQSVFAFKGNAPDDLLVYERSQELLEDLNTNGWLEKFMGCLPGDYHCTSIKAQRVLPTGGPMAIITGGALNYTSGVRPDGISSAQVNPLLIWIPRDHPTKTGRTFLPGVSEDDIDSMALIAALVTDINTFAFEHTSTRTPGDAWGTDVQACVYRRAKVGPPAVAASSDYIDYGRLSPTIGTQRGRLHPV